jgi:hypothetical protein
MRIRLLKIEELLVIVKSAIIQPFLITKKELAMLLAMSFRFDIGGWQKIFG